MYSSSILIQAILLQKHQITTMAHQPLWNADEYSLQLNSAQECNYPETPPQEAQRPHHDHADMDPETPGSLEYNDRDSSAGHSKINGGEEAKKIDGPPCGSSVSKGFTVSKLNAKAPEFIPRGPLSPLQAPTTPPILQAQQTRPVVSQPLPRLMIPQSPRPQALQVYSAGSPRMPVQFPTSPAQVGQACFSASRPLAHGSSPHHSPGAGGLVEYYAENEASDAENTGSAASSSLAKGGVLTEELRQKIVRQVEYYFSDANLSTNDYLMKFVSKDAEGFVPIPVIASFKKVKSLVSNYALVTAALRTSSQLVVSEDGKKVRRVTPMSDAEIEELQSRTVVAENLPEDHTNENIEKIFAAVGNVKTVRICHPQAANGSGLSGSRYPRTDMLVSNKLHALVEYETVEQAEKAVAELNDERNWRSGLRVRLLLRRASKSVHQTKVRKAATENIDSNGEEEEVSTSEAVNDKQFEDSPHQSERHEFMGDEQHSSEGGRRGRGRGWGRGRGRVQLSVGRSHPVGPPQCSSSSIIEVQGKQPPGPRMPDGTRGFTMGRGKPFASAAV